MKRQTIITVLSLILVVLAFLGTYAEARALKLSFNVAPTSTWAKGAERFKELVEERSNGAYTIEIYPNAVLANGNDRVEMEMTQAGVIDFMIKSTIWLSGLKEEFMALSMPWMFPDLTYPNKVMESPTGQELANSLREFNLEPLAWGNGGLFQLYSNRGPIITPEDVKGLKVRVPGVKVFTAIFEEIGAVPVAMSFAEVFSALQAGTVEGGTSPIPLIWSSRFYEVSKYVSIINFSWDGLGLIASHALWNGLSKEDQEMFAKAAQEAMMYQREVAANVEDDLSAQMRELGITITELSEDQLQQFKDAGASVYSEYKERIGTEIVSSIEEEVERIRNTQ
jgi:tripartite ATP-independent transporter DctP family solute receptor